MGLRLYYKSEIAVFLGIAFGGSILLSLVISLTSLVWLAPCTMSIPALATLARTHYFGRPARLNGMDGQHDLALLVLAAIATLV